MIRKVLMAVVLCSALFALGGFLPRAPQAAHAVRAAPVSRAVAPKPNSPEEEFIVFCTVDGKANWFYQGSVYNNGHAWCEPEADTYVTNWTITVQEYQCIPPVNVCTGNWQPWHSYYQCFPPTGIYGEIVSSSCPEDGGAHYVSPCVKGYWYKAVVIAAASYSDGDYSQDTQTSSTIIC